ncbi:histone deacetylase HDT2-like [Iris pallida]|nr:histone deacetylase HDT2-like [Iris pallida]
MKAKDENNPFLMIRNMFRYQPMANHVDDDEDGVDDEVTAAYNSIVAEEVEAKKAAVSRKKQPTESALKTPALEKKAKIISTAGRKTGGNGSKRGAHRNSPY